MTNKLRSVIDNKIKACKGIYGFFPKDDRTNDQELCVKVELVELLIQEGLEEALDAIIEEIEEKYGVKGTMSGNFGYAGVATQIYKIQSHTDQLRDSIINDLKQAREELSTSLTQ